MKKLLVKVLMLMILQYTLSETNLLAQNIIGNWKLNDGTILEFYPNGNAYNAKIVSCPDQKQVGLDMITNLLNTGKKYSSGSIYDYGNGKTYHCSAIVEEDKLKIIGSLDKNGKLGRAFYASRVNLISKNQTEEDLKKSKASAHRIHIVKCLESLERISKIYGVSVEKIMEVNNLTNRGLKIGDQLIIPLTSDILEKNWSTIQDGTNEDNIGNNRNNDEVRNFSQSIPVIQNNCVVSDVDTNIPAAKKNNSNTFAVIIANENYKRETKVDYALNDGEIFKQYCLQTLGLPKSNVHCVKDATLNDFIAEMDWLSKVSNAYNGDARIIVYYAGHGIPDEKTQSSYLLPVDGYGSNVNTGYKLSDMYSTLSTYPAKSVMVFLDACFSGAERNGGMLASARGVALKAKPETPKGNMVVISAASGDETAYKYEEESHGMFTYFLLKKLQEDGADTTLGELADYITTNVARKSIVVNMKSQTPTISASGTLASNWKSLTFNE